MPLVKLQSEKTASTINAQPKSIEKNTVQLIMMYDLCGWGGKQISDQIGISQSRISVIMTSPLYKEERNRRFAELSKQVIDKKGNELVKGDPVIAKFKEQAPEMADLKLAMARDSKSDAVKNQAITECLGYAGYKPETQKTSVSVQVTEKMASRFERVLGMKETSIKVTTTGPVGAVEPSSSSVNQSLGDEELGEEGDLDES